MLPDTPLGTATTVIERMLEGIEGVQFIHFGHADVVRHELVARIARAYDERDGHQAEFNLIPSAARKRR